MYNYGLIRFLAAKSVKTKIAVTLFLNHCGVTQFTYKNHNRVNDYIKSNWNKFAGFIDRSIKDKTIQGHDIKLNTYYDEQRERNEEIKAEFASIELSKDEMKVLNALSSSEMSKVHSFITKQGLKVNKKDYSFTSKKLQHLPNVLLLRENNIVDMCLISLENKKY